MKNPFTSFRDIYFVHFSLQGEWEDNKKSLIEFIWTAHSGLKGMVSWNLSCLKSCLFYFFCELIKKED